MKVKALKVLTAMMALVFMASVEMIDANSYVPIITAAASLMYLGLFCAANNFFERMDKEDVH